MLSRISRLPKIQAGLYDLHQMTKEERSEYWERDYQAAIQPLMSLIQDQNGKMDNLNKKIDDHIVTQDKVHAEMKGEYMELKLAQSNSTKLMQPMIDTFANLRWGEKILIKIGATISGAIALMWGILELVKAIINFHTK